MLYLLPCPSFCKRKEKKKKRRKSPSLSAPAKKPGFLNTGTASITFARPPRGSSERVEKTGDNGRVEKEKWGWLRKVKGTKTVVVRRYRWRMGWAGGVVRASAGLEPARAPSGGGNRGHVLERRRSIGDQSLPRAHRVHVGVSYTTYPLPFPRSFASNEPHVRRVRRSVERKRGERERDTFSTMTLVYLKDRSSRV